eukprot:PITA_04343
MGGFWQELFKLVDTELTPSTNYLPQTDGQTEGEPVVRGLSQKLCNKAVEGLDSMVALGSWESIVTTPPIICPLGEEKLQPRFFGPYRVIKSVGDVAYKLELPPGSRIHNLFHVSCLKRVLGQQITTVMELPPLAEEGHLILEPEAILETRERKLRSRIIIEYLVRWKNLLDEDATWEGEHILEHLTLKLLGDKQHFGGEDYHVPS